MTADKFLDRIVEAKKRRIAAVKRTTPLRELKAILPDLPPPRNFVEALRGKDCAVIAEIKKASPSRGVIREDFSPLQIAAVYEENGAAAISILTEEDFFLGADSYLGEINRHTLLPLLRKDFIIDPYQIYETRHLGGDALLLIARLLGKDVLGSFIALTNKLGMTPLVEVHNAEELGISLAAGAQVIGINNRNLDTFVTDLDTSRKLAPLIPEGILKISESGITVRRDVERLTEVGIHAFLVGEILMRVGDAGRKLRELLGKDVE